MAVVACGTDPSVQESVQRAQIVTDWPLIPARAKFGQVSAVDVDTEGRVFVLHRAGREWSEPFPADPIVEPTVFVFDGASGKVLARWGAGQFIMPHGLSIDPQGKVWITDVAREQVFRFSPEGKLELTLGERGLAGSDARHFGRPTDIAFTGDEVFVSDGYTNTRIAVFDHAGKYLRQWGEPGSRAAGLDLPHAIAVGADRAYVADRENGRIQITTLDGKVLGNWTYDAAKGHPYSLKLLRDGRLISLEGRDGSDRSGATIRIWRADGTVECSLDIALPGNQASLGHDIAVGSDGTAYVADVYGNRVVKFGLDQSGSR